MAQGFGDSSIPPAINQTAKKYIRGMKKGKKRWNRLYGKRDIEVMHKTANKMAMKEMSKMPPTYNDVFGGNSDEQLQEKAKSKAQQRFMGLVRRAQKTGEASSPEVAKAASSMSKSDVKDYASTKHKGLPEKKRVEEGNKSGDSSLRDWFSKSKSSDGKPGWVQLGGKYAGKPCAKQPGQTTKPKCGSSKMKRDLNKDEEERAFRRKNRQDPNPDRKGKAKNVATESAVPGKPAEKLGAVTAIPKDERDAAKARLLAKAAAKRAKKVSESSGEEDHEFEMARRQLSTMKSAAKKLEKKMGKKGEGNLKAWVQSKITKAADYADTAADYVTKEAAGEKDACYHKVKSRYSVWPSAYASGALVKCRKKGAKNWGNKTKKESYSFEINKSDHKKQTKLGKIRNLSKKGSTEGERAAAKRKLGPSLPSESVIMPGSILPEDYQRIQSYGNVYTIIVLWRGTSRRVQLFFQGTARPSREEVKNEVEKIYPGGMVSYYFPSAADPGQPIIVSTRS